MVDLNLDAGIIAAVSGGVIGGFVASYLTNRHSRVAATYREVNGIISPSFASMRIECRRFRETHSDAEIVEQRTEQSSKVRHDITYILNRYEILLQSARDGYLSESIIQRTVWPLICEDHKHYQSYLAVLESDIPQRDPDYKRPFYTAIRHFRSKWRHLNGN